jgi:hypothetical protein
MAQPLTSISLLQLRRDAKRLRQANPELTHAQALDHVAASNGFGNWSQLAHHLVPQSNPQPAMAPASRMAELHKALGLPRMEATRQELQWIVAIVKRFAEVLGEDHEVDRLSLMMDIEACHCNGCPLDLVSLLEVSRDADLVHDIAGIHRHLDRETGSLQNFFLPRYSARAAAPT